MAKTFFNESDTSSRKSYNHLPSVKSYKNMLINDMHRENPFGDKHRTNSVEQFDLNYYKDQTFGKKIKRQSENMDDVMSEHYKREYLEHSKLRQDKIKLKMDTFYRKNLRQQQMRQLIKANKQLK